MVCKKIIEFTKVYENMSCLINWKTKEMVNLS